MNLQITGLRVDVGEGSRGGKIIGYTSSGKSIYESHKHPSHKGFTLKDHTEAMEVHLKLGRKAAETQPKHKMHFLERQKHSASAFEMTKK